MAAPAWSERVRELLKRMNNFHEPGAGRGLAGRGGRVAMVTGSCKRRLLQSADTR